MAVQEKIKEQAPGPKIGFGDSLGANLLNAIINAGQFLPNQLAIPAANEAIANTYGSQRREAPQIPLFHLQDLPYGNSNEKIKYIQQAILQGKSVPEAKAEFEANNPTPTIREAAEAKGALFKGLTGDSVELGILNEVVKKATGTAGFFGRKFAPLAAGFSIASAGDELRQLQEEMNTPSKTKLPLSGHAMEREILARKNKDRIYKSEKPIGFEQSPLLQVFGTSPQSSTIRARTGQAALEGLFGAAVVEGGGKLIGAAAKSKPGQKAIKAVTDLTGDFFKKNIEPVINTVKANYSNYTYNEMKNLVDKVGGKLDEIKGVRDVTLPKVLELRQQVETNNPIRAKDLDTATKLIRTLEDPKFQGNSPNQILKRINEMAQKYIGGEEKGTGVTDLYDEAVQVAERLNTAKETYKQYKTLASQDNFLEDAQFQFARLKNGTERIFLPTAEARNVSAKELEEQLLTPDAKLVLRNNVQDALNVKFNPEGEIVKEPSLYDKVVRDKIDKFTEGSALDELFDKQVKDGALDLELQDYAKNPFQWFQNVSQGVKDVGGFIFNPESESRKFGLKQAAKFKQALTREIFGTYDIMRHMSLSGDKVAKIWLPALDKARGQELNLKGRYWNTAVTESGKSLQEMYDALGLQKGTFQSRAFDWVDRYVPFYKMVSPDGSVEAFNRANPKAFKDISINYINQSLNNELKKVKDPAVRQELEALRKEGIARVERFFNPELPEPVLKSIQSKGVLKVAENSVEQFREIYDKIPSELQDAAEALIKAPGVVADARYKAVLDGLKQKGLKSEEVNLFEKILKEHAKLTDKEKYFLTASTERFTPKHFDLLEAQTKLLRDVIAVDEKLPPESVRDAYAFQQVPKWLKTEVTRKNLEQLLNTKDRKEILQEIAGPYEFARTGNFYFERDARSAIERRIDLSARFQTLEPLLDLIKLTKDNENATQFTRDVIEDFGQKLFNLGSRFGAFQDLPAYQAFRGGVRNVAGQSLATFRFPILNAGQVGLFYAENPELLLKVNRFLGSKELSGKFLKAMEKTGITKEVMRQENISSFTGVSQNVGGIPVVDKDLSAWLDKNITEPMSQFFSRNPNTTARKLIHFITTNPPLAMSEQFLTTQFAMGGLLKHFKGSEKRVLALLNRIEKNDPKARALFNEIIVKSVNGNGFTLNTEFSKSNIQATPILRELATFTTFTIRGVAKMANWIREGNTQALARYLAFITTFTGPNSTLFFDKMLDTATALLQLDNDKAKTRADVDRIFHQRGFGLGPAKITNLGQSYIRNIGKAGQEAIFGTDITPGAPSQALDIDGTLPISYLDKLSQQIYSNPQQALFYLGAALRGETLGIGLPEIGRILGETKGFQKRGSVESEESPLVREEVEGVKFYDRFSRSFEAFPKSIINPARLTKPATIARVLNVSGFEERMQLRAGEVAKIRELSRRFQQAERSMKLNKMDTNAREEKVHLEGRLNDSVKSFINNAVQSGDFTDRKAIEGYLIKSILNTEKRAVADYKSNLKAETLSQIKSTPSRLEQKRARKSYIKNIIKERKRTGNYEKLDEEITDALLLGR